MVGGFVFAAIGAGLISLVVSILAGNPPLVSFALYWLAGCCGVLMLAVQCALRPEMRAD